MKTDTATIRKRYDRLAPFFDLLEAPLEGFVIQPWRERLWAGVEGEHILEIGVGTGKNFAYYPSAAQITAIDFSPKMLEIAERNKAAKHVDVDLALMDVESICYADNSFDTVIASFVFCSAPKPLKGLKEAYRVCKPGGKVLLLEHVISANPVAAAIMQAMNPLVVRLFGANINRDTVKNVRACAFKHVRVAENGGGILKLIEAVK